MEFNKKSVCKDSLHTATDGMDVCSEQRVGHTNWAFGISTEIAYLAERRGQEIAEVIILFKDDLTDEQKEEL